MIESQADQIVRNLQDKVDSYKPAPELQKLHDAISEDVQNRFAIQQAQADQAAFMDHSDALEEWAKSLESK